MKLNSGREVHDEVMARQQCVTRDATIDKLRSQLVGNPLVESAWLVGSLARGEQDPLSDLDLLVTAADGSLNQLVHSLPTLINDLGPVALVNDAPLNAPLGGYQLNVLYDVLPLPLYVDWSVWPLQPRRPTDALVLFERDSTRFQTSGSFDEIAVDMPKGQGKQNDQLSEDYLDHFRIFMTPVIAKDAARGWTASVENIVKHMRLPLSDLDSFQSVISQLREIVLRHGQAQPDVAVACVNRYLSQLDILMGTDT